MGTKLFENYKEDKYLLKKKIPIITSTILEAITVFEGK